MPRLTTKGLRILEKQNDSCSHYQKMKPLPPHAYGLLLTLDGYGASEKICADISGLYRFLEQLPGLIGMRPIGSPHIVSVEEAGIAGLSGFTFIMESHISIHTYQEKGFVTADVYSCKNFDTKKVARYLSEYFHTSASESHTIIRGAQFSSSKNSRARRIAS